MPVVSARLLITLERVIDNSGKKVRSLKRKLSNEEIKN
jgi:hypothetical protein